MCLVEVNTYGIKPKIFEIKIIKKIDWSINKICLLE
jgi:hypothetical protein